MPAPSRATDAKQDQKNSTRSVEATRQNGEVAPVFGAQHSLLSLHRSIGNRAFGQALNSNLPISSPGDVYEQEADRVACEVMQNLHLAGVPPGTFQYEEQTGSSKTPVVKRKGISPSGPMTTVPAMSQLIPSAGRPLDPSTKDFMESRFGHNFDDVRVHIDGYANESASAINAKAYTIGRDIIFGASRYQPHTSAGKQLLAHELAHVVQDRQEGVAREVHRAPEDVPELDRKFTEALKRKDWKQAAEILNAFNREDINARLGKLSSSEIYALHKGAEENPTVGPEAQVARLTAHRFLRAKRRGNTRVDAAIELTRRALVYATDTPPANDKALNILEKVETFLRPLVEDQNIDKYYHGGFTKIGVRMISIDGVGAVKTMQGQIRSGIGRNSGLWDHYFDRLAAARDFLVVLSGETERTIAQMTLEEKLTAVVNRSFSKLPGEVGERLKELLTPGALALMVGFAAVYVVSQTTPVGWVADILVAGLIVATVLMVGSEVVEIVKLLIDSFDKASRANSEDDLDAAAELFARAVSKAGIDIIMAILFHKAGKAANLKPPGPRSPGLVEVLKASGETIKTTITEPAKGGWLVTPEGVRVWTPPEATPATMMMEGGSGTGTPKGGGGAGSGKGVSTKGAGEPSKTLPGKRLAAATPLPKKPTPATDPGSPANKPLSSGKAVSDPVADERGKTTGGKETGAQQEKRLLTEDRASGRPANSATYHAYEGGSRGSFNAWVKNLQSHINAISKGGSTALRVNETPLGENAHVFIERHPNLKTAWEKMNLKIDLQLKEIQGKKSAATGDKVGLNKLEAIEKALEQRRNELTDFENGVVGAKRPDLVEIFFSERRAVVTDITQRTGDPLHNFKTQLYIEVLKEVLGWSDVNGVNFNNVYDQNIVP